MKTPPPRTNTTFLTDDDVLLYDSLTKGRIPITALRQVDYPHHMNCDYTHGFSDAQLITRVSELSDMDLVKVGPAHRAPRCRDDPSDFPNIAVSYSTKGARLWEQERTPDYSLRVSWLTGTNSRRIHIAALARQLLEDFIRVNNNTGQLRIHAPVRFQLHQSLQLPVYFGYRTFRKVFTAAARCEFPTPTELQTTWDIEAYEASRTWWNSIFEPPPKVI